MRKPRGATKRPGGRWFLLMEVAGEEPALRTLCSQRHLWEGDKGRLVLLGV